MRGCRNEGGTAILPLEVSDVLKSRTRRSRRPVGARREVRPIAGDSSPWRAADFVSGIAGGVRTHIDRADTWTHPAGNSLCHRRPNRQESQRPRERASWHHQGSSWGPRSTAREREIAPRTRDRGRHSSPSRWSSIAGSGDASYLAIAQRTRTRASCTAIDGWEYSSVSVSSPPITPLVLPERSG
jgi:hypothetical protein